MASVLLLVWLPLAFCDVFTVFFRSSPLEDSDTSNKVYCALDKNAPSSARQELFLRDGVGLGGSYFHRVSMSISTPDYMEIFKTGTDGMRLDDVRLRTDTQLFKFQPSSSAPWWLDTNSGRATLEGAVTLVPTVVVDLTVTTESSTHAGTTSIIYVTFADSSQDLLEQPLMKGASSGTTYVTIPSPELNPTRMRLGIETTDGWDIQDVKVYIRDTATHLIWVPDDGYGWVDTNNIGVVAYKWGPLKSPCDIYPCSELLSCRTLASVQAESARECYCDTQTPELVDPDTCTCLPGLQMLRDGCVRVSLTQSSLFALSGGTVNRTCLDLDSVQASAELTLELQLETSTGSALIERVLFTSGVGLTVACLYDSVEGSCLLDSGVAVEAPGYVPTQAEICDQGICITTEIAVSSNAALSGATSLCFPPASVTASTLRFDGSNSSSNDLVASNSISELIVFSGNNLVNPSRLTDTLVTYGPASELDRYTCALATSSTTSNVACFTADGSAGTSLMFAITVGGIDIPNPFTFRVPTTPSIFNVTVESNAACKQGPQGVVDCPTHGGDIVTIIGASLLPPLVVFFDGQACANLRILNLTKATCRLPAGTGKNRPVVASAAGLLGKSGPFLSYAGPSITGVSGGSGCVALETGLGLEGCDRTGGGRIVLLGSNLGFADAIVYLGQACQDVRHTVGREHSEVSCLLPPGTLTQIPVLIFIAGTVSPTPMSVSYLPCAPGTFGLEVECHSCAAGEHAPLAGMETCEKCEPGRFSNVNGSSRCDLCLPGRMSAKFGSVDCDVCLPGTFASNAGSALCVACPVGRLANMSEAAACDPCARGTFQDGTNPTECRLCPAGLYSGLGADKCDACQAGTVTDHAGAESCSLCPAGRLANLDRTQCTNCTAGRFSSAGADLLECQNCGAGRYTNKSESSECQICPAGTYQPGSRIAPSSCLLCEPGRFSLPGADECDGCQAGTVASTPGSASCVSCLPPLLTSPEAIRCLCDSGFYASGTDGLARPLCTRCPAGARCDRQGVSAGDMTPLNGWWHSKPGVVSFLRCKASHHCPQTQPHNVNASGCAAQRMGPLCSLCRPGYTSTGSAPCTACPDKTLSLVLTTIITTVLVAVLAVGFFFLLRSELKHVIAAADVSTKSDILSSSSGLAARSHSQSLATINSSASPIAQKDAIQKPWLLQRKLRPAERWTYTLKIAVGFLQITSSMASSGVFRLPALYQEFLGAFSFLSMDFLPWASIDCITRLNLYDKIHIVSFSPVAIFLLLLLLVLLPMWIKDRLDFADDASGRRTRAGLKVMTAKLSLLTLFLAYPSVSQNALKMFMCTVVEDNLYMTGDFHYQCFDEQWWDNLPLVLVYVVVYPVGILVLFGIFLFRARNKLQQRDTLTMGFLYQAYRPSAWWFELLDMLHKLLLVTLVSFLPGQMQVSAALIWVCVYMVVILLTHPYAYDSNDRLALFFQVELLLLLLSAQLLVDLPPSATAELVLSLLLVSCTCMACLWFFLIIIKKSVLLSRFLRRRKHQSAATTTLTAGVSPSPPTSLTLTAGASD